MTTTTFNVDNVKPGQAPKTDPETDKRSLHNLKGLVGLGMEASSANKPGTTTYSTNNFLGAINMAYDQHLPLTLSPDMMWLVIAQGLALHINNNAETLRHQFVDFEGKQEIHIQEDSFQKDSPDNDWPHAFGQFSAGIKTFIGKKHDLIVGEYSTTTPLTKAANEIVLMEAMQKYFAYICHTDCGIPRITLTGTKEDWKDIVSRTRALSEFDLSWWTDKLLPILDEFVNAANGKANKEFWQTIYKVGGGSGGPYLSGWTTHLFPYLKNYKDKSLFTLRNEFPNNKGWGGPTTEDFPNGLSKVPFTWDYYGSNFQMELAAGFTGHSFEEDSVIPQVGWAVRDKGAATLIDCEIKSYREKEKPRTTTWQEMRDFRTSFVMQLEALGFDEMGNYGDHIKGSIQTSKLEQAKAIEGLIVRDWDQSKRCW